MRVWALIGSLGVSACGLGYRGTTETYDSRLEKDFGKIDLNIPNGTGSLRPGVLLIHPGGWSGGDKSNLGAQADRLAREGFVVGNANYRLSTLYPAPVQDVWCALAYLRANAARLELNPDRVAIFGYSAGGYLVDMVGLSPANAPQDPGCPNGTTSRPAGVISGDGPTDLTTIPQQAGFDDLVSLVGGSLPAALPAYQADSPVNVVSPGTPPFLLVHGTWDLLVRWEQSQALYEELLTAGDEAHLLLLRGDGHQLNPSGDFGTPDNTSFAIDSPEAWSAILDFLVQRLGAPP